MSSPSSRPRIAALAPAPESAPLRPKTLPRKPVEKDRHPRRYRGRIAGAGLLSELLRRRGIPRSEVAEDLDVSDNLVADWCTGHECIRLGDILELQNERLALAILDAARDHIRARNSRKHD